MSLVVLADSDFDDLDLERRELRRAGAELVVSDSPAPADVARAGRGAEGLVLMWSRADGALMDLLPRLKVIGRFGTGVDVIDVEEATRRGVAVVNSGHYATEEVAAHALALGLALLRRVCVLDRSVREGTWSPISAAQGIRRISALRAGVVGLGHIGERVARHLQALGFEVAGFDEVARPSGIACAESLDELLRRSDLLTIHVPLLPSTQGLIDAEALDQLPAGAFLVNTSRGPVVDEPALVSALLEGRLGGAALDVYVEEPLPETSRLRELSNVVLTPHVAYYSEEAILEARLRTIRAVGAVLAGERVADRVNPDRPPVR